MTIIDATDIISVTPPLSDKKSLSIDLSDSLFDYDLLLNDPPSATITTTAVTATDEPLFETLFQDESSSGGSNSLSPPPPSSMMQRQQQQQHSRPRIMQWGPQEGVIEHDTIVSVVLQHTEEIGPMKIVFGSMAVETAQQQHKIASCASSSEEATVWITLAASVPPPDKFSFKSNNNNVQVSVCLFDQQDADLAIDTWEIGQFTQLDLPEEVAVQHHSYRKRALSCEPEDCPQKKSTFDAVKQDEDDDDVNSQLLQLLAPYDTTLLNSSIHHDGGGSSSSDDAAASSATINNNNLVSTPSSATGSVSWMSSPLDPHHQRNNYETFNAMLLQQGLIHQGNRSMYNTASYLAPNSNNNNNSMTPTKQDMYRNYLEMQQQRQRQAPPYLVQQQQLMSCHQQQSMNNYQQQYNNNHIFPPPPPPSAAATTTTTTTTTTPSSFPATSYNNRHHHMAAEQQQHLQQMQRLQQQQQQYNNNITTSRRASAPASSSSHSITNSNSCALNKAHLRLNGDLMDMMTHWTMSEWQLGRRLVHFWRHTNHDANGTLSLVECGFEPMDQQVYHQQRMRDNVAAVAAAAAAAVAVTNGSPPTATTNTIIRPTPIVISCIYWRERNDYFITSVDCIYLLESLIGIQFTVEEKNRIRRNLEGFRPWTVSKCKVECADFFKLIMSFPHPKPRNIEKDVKVFAWKTLPHALRKIIRKYTPSYITSTPLEPIQQQHHRYSSSSSSSSSAIAAVAAAVHYGGGSHNTSSPNTMF